MTLVKVVLPPVAGLFGVAAVIAIVQSKTHIDLGWVGVAAVLIVIAAVIGAGAWAVGLARGA